MPQPTRSSSVRLMCFLAAANLTIAGSLKDGEVEVVTLGTLHPPLVSPVRPSGSGHAEAPLDRDREESPDETIARLLRHMFERESQQLLHGEEHKDLQADMPPAAAAAEAEHHPVRTDGSCISPEEETERNFPRGVDAAEVGQEERRNQQQAADVGGSGISSTSGAEVSPQGLFGTDSDSEDDGGRVEDGAAGFSDDTGVDRVEGESVRDASDHVDGEETSGDASAAAGSEAGNAPGSRDVLLEEPEDEKVQHARRKEMPGDPVAVAAESWAEGALHEMSLGQSPDGGAEAAVSLVGEGGGAKVAGPGAFAGLEEDGDMVREQEAAAAGVETEGKETGTDAGVEGVETDRGTTARAVGLGTELGEQAAAVEGELEVGADSTLSHDTPPTAVIPGVDGQHAGEEGEEFESIASVATAKDGAAAAAAEGTSIDEAGAVPGVKLVAGSDDLVDEAPALLSDVVDEEMGGAAVGHVPLGEASFLGIDGDEDEGADKEDAVSAAGVTPVMASAEDDGNEEQDGPERSEEMSALESSGDSEPVRDEGSSPRPGSGDDLGASSGEEGQVGFGGQQLAINSASSESPAGEEDGTDFRPPEERRVAPTLEATDDDGLVKSPASSEPRAARPDELPGAPQAGSEASVAAGGGGGASGVEEEEEPPRPRPVFRFLGSSGPEVDLDMVGKITTTMLRDAENEDGVIAFPPLPPIDALPGSGAKGDGGAGAAEGGSGGGWSGAWGGNLGTAAREKMSRWASEAADRGGVLANRLMEECVARVRRGWHETIEPQTEFARRRLEGVADFCMAEVADHLADPVLAEAL